MLPGSVIEVPDQLRTDGLMADEMDPYVIFSKVCSTIPQKSEGDLVWRFLNRTRADFDSLEAFQKEHQYLRSRMTELELCPPDEFMVICILQKLEDTMPRAYPFLERELIAGNLTWEGLMEDISCEKRREKACSLPAVARHQGGPWTCQGQP